MYFKQQWDFTILLYFWLNKCSFGENTDFSKTLKLYIYYHNVFRIQCTITVVAKMIRTLVFSLAKQFFLSNFYLLLQCVSKKYQITFPNIHFAIKCNHPVRFLFAQEVWQQPVRHTEIWSDHHPVCLEWHEETEQTKSRRTVATSPRCFKKPPCKAFWKTMRKCTREKAALNAKNGHTKC